VLEYARFDKFKQVIEQARVACESSGYEPSDHSSRVGTMLQIGSGAMREIEDFHLSRYACYLIVQNADPETPVVALGQTYFAGQTRLQELTEDQRRTEMREAVAEHGKLLNAASEVGVVTARDFATCTDHGYMGLYAGEKARDIHTRKGLKKGRHILDWMGYEELADNMFRQVQAEGAHSA
jgi:DNA-damage-inducible protein D